VGRGNRAGATSKSNNKEAALLPQRVEGGFLGLALHSSFVPCPFRPFNRSCRDRGQSVDKIK